MCAADQGKYFEYQHALYAEAFGAAYNRTILTDLAGRIELNRDVFTQCLSDGTHRDTVESARRAAVNRGVSSTPTFFINNQKVEGNRPFEFFQQAIEQQLSAQ